MKLKFLCGALLVSCAHQNTVEKAEDTEKTREALQWLSPAHEKELFPTIQFQRVAPELSWTLVDPQMTEIWRGDTPKRSGSGISRCLRADGSTRLTITGSLAINGSSSSFSDVLNYPDLSYVTRALPDGALGSRAPEGPLDCFTYSTWSRSSPLTFRHQETGEIVDISGSFPSTDASERYLPHNKTLLTWTSGEAIEVDLVSLDYKRVTPPQPKTDIQRPPFLRGCHHAGRPGLDYVMVCGDTYYLWSPTENTIREIEWSQKAEKSSTFRPYMASRHSYEVLWDPERSRFLRLPNQDIEFFTSRNGDERFGMSEDRAELRRYDVDKATYQVVRRYSTDDCPGVIGLGESPRRTTNGRFEVVVCLVPLKKNDLDSKLVWSEVLDFETGQMWRTHLSIREVGSDGDVLAVNSKYYDNSLSFQRAWSVKLGDSMLK